MKNYLLHAILFILSYLVPKKDNLIIFGSGDSKQFQGNPKYIYQFLRSIHCDKLEYYWSSKSKAQQEFLSSMEAPYIDPYSFLGFFCILRARYLVIEKSTFDVYYTKMIFGRFNFVQTWHGTPLKRIGVGEDTTSKKPGILNNRNSKGFQFLKKIKFFSRQKFKLILAPSKNIQTLFQGVFDNPNVSVTGYPRNDILFMPYLATKDYAKILNLEHIDKVILYAPTWRDDNESLSPLSKNLDDYNEELKRHNYLLLVKKHPWQKTFIIPENLSNILNVSESVDDIQELYPHIDILINDYSSAFFDFMLTQKPVIFYPYDLDAYLRNCRGMYFDYFDGLPGPFAHNEKELFQLIFSIEDWKNGSTYLKKYKAVLDKYNQFQDGHSSERVLKLLFPQVEFSTKINTKTTQALT